MKKSLLALTLSAALFSCKKDIEQKSLSANDISGNGWVKGVLRKTIITPDGFAGWTNGTKVPAANVGIQVRVQTNGAFGIYPNSNFQSTEVFTGISDANGNFAIPVKSNGTSNGVNATIIIEGFQATQDTLINGVTKPGRLCNYFGQSANLTVFKGQSAWWNNIAEWAFYNGNMTVASDLTNPTSPALGTAIITGSVGYSVFTQSITANTQTTGPANSTNMIANSVKTVADGTKIYYTFNVDPLTLTTKVYQTATSNGSYTFNVNTVNAGTNGFNQDGVVWVNDYPTLKDTVRVTTSYNGTVNLGTNSTTIPGKAGVYNAPAGINQNGLYSNEIRNAVNILYTGFTAN